MDVYSKIGETILPLLEFCSASENRRELEARAVERGITCEQLVTAAILGRLEETFPDLSLSKGTCRTAAQRSRRSR